MPYTIKSLNRLEPSNVLTREGKCFESSEGRGPSFETPYIFSLNHTSSSA